jgi:hypothetical protein
VAAPTTVVLATAVVPAYPGGLAGHGVDVDAVLLGSTVQLGGRLLAAAAEHGPDPGVEMRGVERLTT